MATTRPRLSGLRRSRLCSSNGRQESCSLGRQGPLLTGLLQTRAPWAGQREWGDALIVTHTSSAEAGPEAASTFGACRGDRKLCQQTGPVWGCSSSLPIAGGG